MNRQYRPTRPGQQEKPGQLKTGFFSALLLINFFLCSMGTTAAPAQQPANLNGTWTGDWGQVELESIGPLSYVGTYSDTYGKDVGRLTFSFVDGKYEGKWWEGTYRLGPITLAASEDGNTLTGTWSASPASTINPGEPGQAAFRWTRK